VIGRFFRNGAITWADLIGTWQQLGFTWNSLAGNNPYDSLLLGFDDGVTGNVDFTTISELAWSMRGVFLMGDVRHSKTIQKFRVCIFDAKQVTFTVTLTNQFGVTVSETVTMGTGSGNDISRVLALKISGIRINWTISGAAGQYLQLVEFAPMFKTAGEQRGGTVDS
jgi:hypothetical protein